MQREPETSLSSPTNQASVTHALPELDGVTLENPNIGAPGWVRTSDLMLRRHVLYPAELRAREPLRYLSAAGAARLRRRLRAVLRTGGGRRCCRAHPRTRVR